MNQLKDTTNKKRELIEFAESKGWSREDLAKVINLLNSEIEQECYLDDSVQKAINQLNQEIEKFTRF